MCQNDLFENRNVLVFDRNVLVNRNVLVFGIEMCWSKSKCVGQKSKCVGQNQHISFLKSKCFA